MIFSCNYINENDDLEVLVNLNAVDSIFVKFAVNILRHNNINIIIFSHASFPYWIILIS